MVAEIAAAEDWDAFKSDAAAVLPVIEEVHSATPAFFEEPFSEIAQERMREFLNSSRLDRASAAAHRLSGHRLSAGGI